MVGSHNEGEICPSNNYNRGKSGGRKEKRRTENDVIGLDDEGGLQQVEGKSRTMRPMETMDVRTCLGKQRTKKMMKLESWFAWHLHASIFIAPEIIRPVFYWTHFVFKRCRFRISSTS